MPRAPFVITVRGSLSEGAREARIDLKALRKEKEEEDVNLELYGAGIAD